MAIPIKSFPCPGAIMQRQIKECEDGFIDFFGIDIHARATHVRSTESKEELSLDEMEKIKI
jgi:hypothetical protein